MRILLQFPEGLKQKGLELAKKYEDDGHQVFLSASPCYGACDICLDEARWINADKIIHFGHNKFVKNDLEIPVEYVPYHLDMDIEKLESVLPHIEKYKNIGLGTIVQQSHQFDRIKEFFEKNGKTVHAETGYFAHEKGQVLGCDAIALSKVEDKVECFVFIGNGVFHPTAIDTKKPVFLFNIYDNSVKEMNSEIERIRKRRKGSIARALTCRKFAILLSTKVGQFNLKQAEWAKSELEKRGLEAAILVANELEPITVKNFMTFDCLVNTACPRIVDDTEEFEKPILNIGMLKELFGLIDDSG